MNQQAHVHSKATAGRFGAAVAGLAFALCAAVPVSHAFASGPNDGPPRRENQQQQQQQQPPARGDSRWGNSTDPRSFEARAEEQRRIMQENANNAELSRRMSRMTPDERRDLRRQINEAGMEVYSTTPKR